MWTTAIDKRAGRGLKKRNNECLRFIRYSDNKEQETEPVFVVCMVDAYLYDIPGGYLLTLDLIGKELADRLPRGTRMQFSKSNPCEKLSKKSV